MARSVKGDGESSQAEATTLQFGSKDAWKELAETKRTTSKRSKSASGQYGKLVTKMVNEQHMDRKAIQIVMTLDAIEDDSDLHVTVHHILDGMVKRGILKRAMVSDALELFEEHKVGPAVRRAKEAAAEGKKKGADKKAAGDGREPQGAGVLPFPAPSGAAAE